MAHSRTTIYNRTRVTFNRRQRQARDTSRLARHNRPGTTASYYACAPSHVTKILLEVSAQARLMSPWQHRGAPRAIFDFTPTHNTYRKARNRLPL